MKKFGYLTFVLGIIAGVLLMLMLNQYEHLFTAKLPYRMINALLSPDSDTPSGRYESSYFYVLNQTNLQIKETELAKKVKETFFDPRNQKDMLYNDVRILCLVHIEKDVVKMTKAAKDTWAGHCNKVVFISSSTDTTIQDLHHVNVGNKPELTWERSKQSLLHAIDKYKNDFDWFLKVETNMYVLPENLRYLVLVHSSSVPGYVGHVFLGDKGEAAFVLSRQGLETISPKLPDCPVVDGRKDDVVLTRCFRETGVVASTHGIDHTGQLRFEMIIPDHKLPSNTLASTGFTARYWRYVKFPEKKGAECCYEYAITYNNVNHGMMYILEHTVYHLRPYGVGVALDSCKPPDVEPGQDQQVPEEHKEEVKEEETQGKEVENKVESLKEKNDTPKDEPVKIDTGEQKPQIAEKVIPQGSGKDETQKDNVLPQGGEKENVENKLQKDENAEKVDGEKGNMEAQKDENAVVKDEEKGNKETESR